MKLHEIMISVGLVGLLFLGFAMFWAEGVIHYGVTDMNQSKLASLNSSLNDLNDIAEDTSNAMSLVQGIPGLDILGSAVIGAFGALRTAVTSIDLINDITSDTANYLPLGDLTSPFTLFVGASLLIIIFVAVLANYLKGTGGV